MHFNLKFTILTSLGLLLLLLFSCTKDEIIDTTKAEMTTIENRESPQMHSSEPRPVILGDEINNPYTVERINEAMSLLYSNPETVSATHNIMRFRPQTHDDLVTLLDWSHENSVVMFDYPIHYELLEEGDYYVDPEVSDPALLYQYASIPVEMALPGVTYELVDELYLDETNPFLFIKAYQLTGHLDKLNKIVNGGIPYNVVMKYGPNLGGEGPQGEKTLCPLEDLPPPPDCPENCTVRLIYEEIAKDEYICEWWCDCPPVPPPPPPTNDCGCPVPADRRVPAGCIRVDDDGGVAPVRIVRVRVWDFHFPFLRIDNTFTDRRGCWAMPRPYNEFRLNIIFENDNLKVRSTRHWAGLRVLRDRVRRFRSPPYNDIETRYDEMDDRQDWAASHTHNTDLEYRDMAIIDNIPLPRARINYLITPQDLRGSAPMLQGNNFPGSAAFLNILGLTLAVPNSLGLLPDIMNTFRGGDTAVEFNDTGFHELGHTSHYRTSGEAYWAPYRGHIVANRGEGDFPNFLGNNAGYVALGEAVGEFTEERYGPDPQGDGLMWRGTYMPAGLMVDLEDPVSTTDRIFDITNPAIRISDVISGFTPEMMFDALDPNVNSIRDFRERLRVLHFAGTGNNLNDYNNFVDVYDVFN